MKKNQDSSDWEDVSWREVVIFVILVTIIAISAIFFIGGLNRFVGDKDNTQVISSEQNEFITVHSTVNGNTRTFNINVSHIAYIENHYIFFDETYNTSIMSMYVDETMDEIMEMINK